MDNLVKNIYKEDLTGVDVDFLSKNKAKLLLYKDLLNYNTIFDAFGKFNNIILLFPVQSDTRGHWVCIRLNTKHHSIRHWDSYGISYVQEMGYTDNEYVKQRLLNNLYDKAMYDGWTVQNNTYRYQEMRDGINTCGRWACIRARFDYLNNDEFAKLFLKQHFSADFYVTLLTFTALSQDEEADNEEMIIRELGLRN